MAELPFTASLTREAIFAAYEADVSDGFRAHLGASLIGKDCERALWFDFRWVTRARHHGRLLRLFETGQLEEARLVQNLRRTGATVLEVDPDTGRQFRVEAHGGHFGGSLDGLAINLLEAPKTWHVLEFKTHSVKSFNDLLAKKVQGSKPLHVAQMQTYMHLTGLTRALYVAVCKDTDDIYVERLEVDHAFAQGLLGKAKRVIFAATPPAGISKDPTWYQCRMCDHAPVCHVNQVNAAAAEINCRT
ncbi:MAG: oxidoreductase, partial [Burkholderiaceae bacterium]|nr:oxidoreductase [Burkholderiaceae bacterium]